MIEIDTEYREEHKYQVNHSFIDFRPYIMERNFDKLLYADDPSDISYEKFTKFEIADLL